MNVHPLLRVGTRGSPLALAQTRQVCDRLATFHSALAGPETIVAVHITTTGDAILNRPLAEIGGKGLFTKEIDEALLRGTIDLAIHSMKDVQTVLPDGLTLAAVLEREDPRDALVSLKASSLTGLPTGAVVGTASLRRGAQILLHRPDLKVVPLRGNVQTRLQKLTNGVIDATLLAVAGLRRLGLADWVAAILSPDVMLPAAGQGAIGIVCRADDSHTRALLQPLDHVPTALCVAAERAFLAALDGNCRTPIAALAEVTETGTILDPRATQVRFRGLVVKAFSPPFIIECRGPAAQVVRLAEDAGRTAMTVSGEASGTG